MNKIIIVIVLSIAIIGSITSYSMTQQSTDQTISDNQDKITVFTTFYAMNEFTKNVVGDKATVENLIPFNVEPHDYEITPKKLQSLYERDIIVYNGANFEPFVTDVIDSGSFGNLMFVDTTENIKLLDASHDEHESHEELRYDPHVWLDPILAKQQVQAIANAMSKKDPDNTQYYLDNAQSYSKKLDVLDAKIRQELSSCKKDTFVPFHNAFTYFAERYGLHAEPLSGISPETEATAKEIVDFIKFAKDNDIKYFFTEEMVNTKLSEQLAREVGGGILVFSPLEGLTSEDQKRNATYIDKMDDNLQVLKIALECR
jgi:zinc transport system substrate-binding protein